MKILYKDDYLIGTPWVSSVNEGFPASALLTEHIEEVWKAQLGTNQATIIVNILAGATAVALFGCNAISAVVTVRGAEEAEWSADAQWSADAEWVEAELDPVTSDYQLSPSGSGGLWAEFAARSGPSVVEIVLTAAAGVTLEVGVLRAGVIQEFTDPLEGVDEGLKNYSIKNELNHSGAFDHIKKGIARTFGFDLNVNRDTDFYRFMLQFAAQVGEFPYPWRIVSTNLTNFEWVVYAGLDGMPAGKHGNKPAYSDIKVKLLEVV